MADIELVLIAIPVHYKDGTHGKARAEGNNAAWQCACGEALPLIGRCYFQFGHNCHTVCPSCAREYRVERDLKKKAKAVREM